MYREIELIKSKEYFKMVEEDIRRLEDENVVSFMGFGNDDGLFID